MSRAMTQTPFKAVERQLGLGKRRRRIVDRAALPGAAVAIHATDREKDALAVGGIARRRILRACY